MFSRLKVTGRRWLVTVSRIFQRPLYVTPTLQHARLRSRDTKPFGRHDEAHTSVWPVPMGPGYRTYPAYRGRSPERPSGIVPNPWASFCTYLQWGVGLCWPA
jgi:hypothetical protein